MATVKKLVLPCLHTLDEDDARAREAEGSAGGGFACDVCHQRCTIKADELLEDVEAEQILAAPPLCDCEEGPATVYCDNCGLYFGTCCDETVHSRGKRKAHVRVPIKEHLSGGGAGEGKEKKKLMCPIHKEYPLTFFCKQDCCGTTICAMCAAEAHKAHDYIKLSEASGASRQEIEVVASLAADALVGVSDGIVAVNKRRKEVEDSKDATYNAVQQEYKMAQAGIIAQMKKVQADTKAEGGRKEAVLVKQKDELQAVKGRLESGLELANRVQEGASEVKLLQIKRTLVDGLTSATSHGVPLQPLCGPSVMFVKSAEWLAMAGTFPMLGSISGSDTNPSACTAEGAGLQEASVGKEAEFAVTAVDFQGEKRTSGGDGIALTVVGTGGGGGGAAGAGGGGGGSGNVEITVVDHRDGTYACKYTLPEGSPEGQCQLNVLILGQHIQGSPFAVLASAGKRFVHTGPFDANGVLHWIGTGCGTKGYANPHGKPGGVVAKKSSLGDGTNANPEGFVDHAQVGTGARNYTDNTPDSWMSVDLGKGRQLAPDHYCLRHWTHAGCGDYALRHWRLEGSNDDSTWTPLKTHANDAALAVQAGSTASWPIQAAAGGAAYRYFRILQTGKNTSNSNYLMCNGIELYGRLSA